MIRLILLASLASTRIGDPSALDYAFQFASAIVSDPKDMAKAQEAVVWDLASASEWEAAIDSADRIEGWRRGTAYADLATALANAGRNEQARSLIAKALAFQPTISGWQNLRIAAHVANAWAALGENARAEMLASAVAAEDPHQYAGRRAATVAVGLAARGRFEEAATELVALAGARDLDDTWWRTVGYLEMSRQEALSKEHRVRALTEARRSAAGIPTWKKAEALERIADEYVKHGMTKDARELVAETEGIVVALPDTLPIKAPLLSSCARAWAALGREERARPLLAQVEALIPAVQAIDRPAVYANVARITAVLGDAEGARRVFAKALDEAGALVNARPRALAIVEVCRSISGSGLPLDAATRGRLDSLYANLEDPW